MSEWPPPTGEPVVFALAADPWAEQARRREQHRRQRRRRLLVIATVAAAFVGGAALVAFRRSIDPVASDATASDLSQPAALDDDVVVDDLGSDGVAGSSTELASVEEVWLLDRGGRTFDWGSVVSSATDVTLGDVTVKVVVFDGDGNEVFTTEIAVPQLAPDVSVVLGGSYRDDESTPTRIEVTVSPGVEMPDAVVARFAVSDVRRVSAGQVDSDDRLLGDVEMVAGERGPVRVAALWRDDDGEVIASVFSDLDVVDVGESVNFSLRLPRTFVPPGEPDTITAVVGAAS